MQESTRNRLRLWLKSEQAMGLRSVGPAPWCQIQITRPTLAHAAQATASSRTSPPPTIQSVRAATPRSPAPPRPAPIEATVAAAAAPQAPGAPLPGFTSAPLPLEERAACLAAIDQDEVRGCTRCPLCQTRKQTVFGEGDPGARLMFIGEGPGAKEDQTGRPFVGPAGELLTRMIGAMGLTRQGVYIANVVKCRAFLPGPPPKDRAPAAEEVAACASYLTRQLEIIRPAVIVTLGLPATQFVLQTRLSMSRLRGNWNLWHGIRVMPTWHPSYLLRREKDGDIEPKRQAWADLQQVMTELGLTVAKKGE